MQIFHRFVKKKSWRFSGNGRQKRERYDFKRHLDRFTAASTHCIAPHCHVRSYIYSSDHSVIIQSIVFAGSIPASYSVLEALHTTQSCELRFREYSSRRSTYALIHIHGIQPHMLAIISVPPLLSQRIRSVRIRYDLAPI